MTEKYIFFEIDGYESHATGVFLNPSHIVYFQEYEMDLFKVDSPIRTKISTVNGDSFIVDDDLEKVSLKINGNT